MTPIFEIKEPWFISTVFLAWSQILNTKNYPDLHHSRGGIKFETQISPLPNFNKIELSISRKTHFLRHTYNNFLIFTFSQFTVFRSDVFLSCKCSHHWTFGSPSVNEFGSNHLLNRINWSSFCLQCPSYLYFQVFAG